VWSNPNSEIQISEKSAEIQEKSSLSHRKNWTFWSCWADSNRRPHPYQLIANSETAGIQQFPGLFVPGK